MKTINEKWREFWTIVRPFHASAEQERECKRMFFAGFAACLDAVIVSEQEEFVPMIQSFRKQLVGFNEAVKIGGA